MNYLLKTNARKVRLCAFMTEDGLECHARCPLHGVDQATYKRCLYMFAEVFICMRGRWYFLFSVFVFAPTNRGFLLFAVFPVLIICFSVFSKKNKTKQKQKQKKKKQFVIFFGFGIR